MPAPLVTSPAANDDAEIDLLLRQARADRMDPGERYRGLPHPCFSFPIWAKYDSFNCCCTQCGMGDVEMKMRYQTIPDGARTRKFLIERGVQIGNATETER